MGATFPSMPTSATSDQLYELPFDQFQRYKGVQEVIDQLRHRPRLRILDVGGAPGHMSDFLPDDSIVILDSQRAIFAGRDGVKGSGMALPFHDKAFDAAIAIDVFEHIPPDVRRDFVVELLRVSRRFVIVAAPFWDEKVAQAERLIYEYVLKEMNVSHEFLIEHLEYGLPDAHDLSSFLVERGLWFTSIPNGYLYHWLIMMGINHYLQSLHDAEMLHRMLNRFYNESFYEADRRMPCYRRIFVISADEAIIRVAEAYARESIAPDAVLNPAQIEMLRVGVELFRTREVKEHLRRLQSLEEQLRRQEQIIRRQDETLDSIFRSFSWRLMLKADAVFKALVPHEPLRQRIRERLRKPAAH